ncbi:MAG: terpene cyclase/mutase family protein [Planctomycetes bacterium]|nr:terpene cyclase/mutase family protein [Planctomycetota bacterium]
MNPVISIVCIALIAAPARAQGGERIRPEGVTEAIQSAIDRGLQYLTRVQSPDGSWRSAGRRGAYPTAMTALAGMAMIGAGSTPTRGKQWLQVRRATSFLLSAAQSDGVITVPDEEGRSMYGHGFSTMFLAQVFGMEEDQRRQHEIHGVLTRAVQLISRSQSRAGGWLYTPESSGDEGSVTVTQVQALRACRNAGVTVPSKTIENAIKYIHDSANPDGSIRYSVNNGGGGRAPITAAAVAVLYNAGNYDDPIAEKALEYALKTLPVNGSGNGHHYYAQLYLAQALYQQGGEEWTRYYDAISKWLLAQQSRDGSWNGDGIGPVYGTSIALTILQLPHSFVPIYQR